MFPQKLKKPLALGDARKLMDDLLKHQCSNCGSVPVDYPGSNSPNNGILTFNYVKAPYCVDNCISGSGTSSNTANAAQTAPSSGASVSVDGSVDEGDGGGGKGKGKGKSAKPPAKGKSPKKGKRDEMLLAIRNAYHNIALEEMLGRREYLEDIIELQRREADAEPEEQSWLDIRDASDDVLFEYAF